jgi:hypothetical protein
MAKTNAGQSYGLIIDTKDRDFYFKFSGEDGDDLFRGFGKPFPWRYERLEFWADQKLLFAIPTVRRDDVTGGGTSGQQWIKWNVDIAGKSSSVMLHCHMLLLNGERKGEASDAATTVELNMEFGRRLVSGRSVHTLDYLTIIDKFTIGSSSLPERLELEDFLGALAHRFADGGFSETLIGDHNVPGPLLAHAFHNEAFCCGSEANKQRLNVVLDNGGSACVPTLAFEFLPSRDVFDTFSRPVPLPITPDSGTDRYGNSPFALPVIASDGRHRDYRLVQRASNDWLSRKTLTHPEEWLLILEASGYEEIWNTAVRQYKAALHTVRPGNRLTLLPEIIATHPDTPNFRLSFLVQRLRVDPQNPNSVRFETNTDSDLQFQVYLLELIGPDIATREGALPGSLNARLKFSVGSDIAGLFYTAELTPDPGTALDWSHPRLGMKVTLLDRIDAQGASIGDDTDESEVRIGSLDIQFSKAVPKVNDPSGPEIGWRCQLTLQNLDAEWNRVPRLHGLLWLPVAKVVPGGQDGLPSAEYVPEGYSGTTDRDETCMESRFTGGAPVVIPVLTDAPRAGFMLQVDESNPTLYSQTVDLKLLRRELENAGNARTDASKTPRVIVLDSDPFLVAAVEYPALAPAPNSNVVALWRTGNNMGDDSERAWQLRSAAQPFNLILPPQILGEEMPKAKELNDRDANAADLKPLDFRLGASEVEQLQASYTPQNFAEAPWNLRRILGYPGQRDAGAGVRQLNFELVYGLSTSVDTSLLRLAEVMSLLGRVPGRIPALQFLDKADKPLSYKDVLRSLSNPTPDDLYRRRRWDWSIFAELYSRRVAVLEPRISGSTYADVSGLTGASATPETLTISQGVSAVFRGKADLYYSVDQRRVVDAEKEDGFPVQSDGLKGGVSWPFESPRIFQATVRNPHSSSATVSGLQLSPLGATGTLKAGFDKDLSTITAVSAIGRTNKMSVTRLGRIGVFHNLARYVIEYERTVSVSKQFNQLQTEFRRRPAFRKVREYVEILEPVVTLSDSTQTVPGGGCAKTIEFKQRIIPVTSTWSSNVGTTGWKIPLWYQRTSNVRPANGEYVYPRPEVVFNMAGADGADVECAIETVDRLFFYTETNESADPNPHNWPIVSGVDFLAVPAPTPNPAFPSSTIGEIPAYDPPLPFGLSSLTHTIAQGTGRINLSYGRAQQAVGAALNAVTLQRGPQAGVTAIPAVQSTLQQIHDGVRRDLFNAVRSNPPQVPDLAKTICGQIEGLSTQMAAQVSKTLQVVIDQEKTLLQRWLAQANKEIDLATDELRSRLQAANDAAKVAQRHITLDEIKAEAYHEVDALYDRLKTLPVACNALAQFTVKVQEQLADLAHSLNEPHDALQAFLNDLHASGSHEAADLQKQFDDLNQRVQVPLELAHRLLAQVRSQVQARAEAWMPAAGVLCHYWEDPISSALDAVQGVVTQAQIVLSYANSGADSQIDTATATLNSALEGARAALINLAFPSTNDVPGLPSAQQQKDFVNTLNTYATYAKDLPNYLQSSLDASQKAVTDQIDKWIVTAQQQVHNYEDDWMRFSLAVFAQLEDQVLTIKTVGSDGLNGLQQKIVSNATNITNYFNNQIKGVGDYACNRVKALQHQAIEQLEMLRRSAENALGRLAETIAHALPIDIQLPPGGSIPVMLQHAFGKVPEVPNLSFSLPTAAYFFKTLDPHVNLTPLLTKVKSLVPNLTPLSTMLPSYAIGDRMLPIPHLPNFDLNNILPDFAGLKLTNLFPRLKMPFGSSDAVKVTHDVDVQSRTAWVKANIDITTDTASIFSVGPMAIRIVSPRFTSEVLAKATGGGAVSKQASGAITGDWQLIIGGSPMITLKKTALSFDNNGKLHMNVSPDRVELSAALSFIQEIVSRYTSPSSGLRVYPYSTGIETRLSLPIPNTSLGTTGITNLTFNFVFGLSWANKFRLYAGFGLASPNAPFNLSIFILGGGGYLTATADYTPGAALSCSVDMGIDVSAAAAIALGPISGSVHINLGMRFGFHSGQGDLALGFYLVIGGEVSVLGIISASILLRLDATYQSGSFHCRGLFQIQIKICWCFTLEVSEEVSCNIGSGEGISYSNAPAFPWAAADTSSMLLGASAISSVPPQDEMAKYKDYADHYLQLID